MAANTLLNLKNALKNKNASKKEVSEHVIAFNQHVDGFLVDLEKIFGPQDQELLLCKGIIAFRSMNPFLLMSGFQKHFLTNGALCYNILTENVDYFIENDFTSLVDETEATADFTKTLLQKVKFALLEHRHDKDTLMSVFHWMKLLLSDACKESGKSLEEIVSM